MKVFIVSRKILSELKRLLEREGEVVLLRGNEYLPEPEASHADMQVYEAGPGILILKTGFDPDALAKLESLGFTVTLSGSACAQKYPECASHNVLRCGNFVMHKLSATDHAVASDIAAKHLVPVNVSQGYTGCSSVYIDDLDLIVTGDPSVIKASAANSFNLFKVPETVTESIALEGLDHGFIGGCCGFDKADRTLYVSGNLDRSIPELAELLLSAGIRIVQADGAGGLADIGGIKVLRI
ncbi:MAG: hypothetical protein ILO53_07040 [Clostridia bacterium]|nr:hypothetical protein [Clostridia bacterium]